MIWSNCIFYQLTLILGVRRLSRFKLHNCCFIVEHILYRFSYVWHVPINFITDASSYSNVDDIPISWLNDKEGMSISAFFTSNLETIKYFNFLFPFVTLMCDQIFNATLNWKTVNNDGTDERIDLFQQSKEIYYQKHKWSFHYIGIMISKFIITHISICM